MQAEFAKHTGKYNVKSNKNAKAFDKNMLLKAFSLFGQFIRLERRKGPEDLLDALEQQRPALSALRDSRNSRKESERPTDLSHPV